MNIIERAARRLDELNRAGVEVPWAAAGVSEAEALAIVGSPSQAPPSMTAQQPAKFQPEDATPSKAPTHPVHVESSTQRATDVERPARLVTVDTERLAREGYLVPGERRSALTDEFRAIKRPLLKNARGESVTPVQRGNLIMVTSALPGEGKTFCALNLALSMAVEVDISVLLIDADVIRPSLMNRLGIAGRFDGLLDVLSNPGIDVNHLTLGTNIGKLRILPPGQQRFDSTELLASAAMEALLDGFAREHPDQIVIFDSPPLLVTTESKVLASRVGQILVVVDEGKTSPQDVTKAFSIVSGMPLVASLLNKSRTPSEADRYGYRYGYYEA